MSYDISKTYEGQIAKCFPEKLFGFIRTIEIGDVFFHYSRFCKPISEVRVGKAVSFKLIYSKRNPGKVAATQICQIESYLRQKIIKLESIDNEKKFKYVCEYLSDAKYNREYEDLANLAYNNSVPLYKLRLWINEYVKHFDFDLFKKYHFRLNRYEAAKFKSSVKEIIKKTKRNEFRILGRSKKLEILDNATRIYETSWRDIGFENGQIFINIGLSEAELLPYKWRFSKDDFNLIVTDYISRKNLKSIKSKIYNGRIVEVEGLDQLQDAIKTIERYKAKKTIEGLIKEGYTPRAIREHPEFVTLKNEDLLRLFGNHECIDYLQRIQTTNFDMPLIYIVEKRPVSSTGGISFESSYLFSVVLRSDKIAIIWESVKLDRATQVFICESSEYFDLIRDIDDFLTSFESKKRSTLKSDTEVGKSLREQLKFRTSVEHTEYNFEKWLKNLKRAIPEIEKIENNS